MKKSWFIMLFLSGSMMFGIYRLWADGAFVTAPGPVIGATGQNYAYPVAPATSPGALLVQDGIGTFRYSNAVVTTTTSLVALQFPALPLVTAAQELLLTAATTGQMIFCTNCANAGATKGAICVSTGSTNVDQFVTVSTGATASAVVCQ